METKPPRSRGRSQGWWVGCAVVRGPRAGKAGAGGLHAEPGLGVRRQVEVRKHSACWLPAPLWLHPVPPSVTEPSWLKHRAEAPGCVRAWDCGLLRGKESQGWVPKADTQPWRSQVLGSRRSDGEEQSPPCRLAPRAHGLGRIHAVWSLSVPGQSRRGPARDPVLPSHIINQVPRPREGQDLPEVTTGQWANHMQVF